LALGVLLVGIGLIWANATGESNSRLKAGSIAACERNVADRLIQQEGWAAAEQARRAAAARGAGESSSTDLRAAEQYEALQTRLQTLIDIDCEGVVEPEK
jgi:stage V sporulation protein SpoVS